MFSTTVDLSLLDGYIIESGILLDDASKYKNKTIAETYANGEFDGYECIGYTSTSLTENTSTVWCVLNVIDGLVTENNKENLNYEFAAAAYFTLTNSYGNTTTVVVNQKTYSVKSMVKYYLNNSSSLGIDKETVEIINTFDEYIK